MTQFSKNMIKPWAGLLVCVTALLLMGGTALAVVNLDNPTPVVFANEIAVDTSNGTALANPGNILDIKAQIGLNLGDGATYYVRFDLSSNATIITDPGDGALTLTGVGTTTATITQMTPGATNGGAGYSFAIYSLADVVDGDFIDESNGYLNLALQTDGLEVTDENSVTMTYTIYTSATDAQNAVNAVYSKAMVSYINWADALTVTNTAVTPLNIDIADSCESFVGSGLSTNIGDVAISVTSNVLWTDGLQAAIGDIIAAGSKLVITGTLPTGTVISDNGSNDWTETIALGTAEWAFGATAYDSGNITYTLAASTVAIETAFTGLLDFTPATGSDVQDVNLGTLSTLAKNGVTRTVFNIPSPAETTFVNAVRISNTSNVSGTVYGRLYEQTGGLVYSGVLIGTGGLQATIAPQETVPITASGWTTLDSGLSTWVGRGRLVVETTLPSIEVMSLTTVGGVQTNMSTVAPVGVE